MRGRLDDPQAAFQPCECTSAPHMKPQYTEAFSELPAGLLLTVTEVFPLIWVEVIAQILKTFFCQLFNDTSVLELTFGSSTPRDAGELCKLNTQVSAPKWARNLNASCWDILRPCSSLRNRWKAASRIPFFKTIKISPRFEWFHRSTVFFRSEINFFSRFCGNYNHLLIAAEADYWWQCLQNWNVVPDYCGDVTGILKENSYCRWWSEPHLHLSISAHLAHSSWPLFGKKWNGKLPDHWENCVMYRRNQSKPWMPGCRGVTSMWICICAARSSPRETAIMTALGITVSKEWTLNQGAGFSQPCPTCLTFYTV